MVVKLVMHLNNLSDEKSNRSTNPVIGKISQNMHLLVNVGILKIMKISMKLRWGLADESAFGTSNSNFSEVMNYKMKLDIDKFVKIFEAKQAAECGPRI